MTSLCEPRIALDTSVVVCDFVDVGDQEGVAIMDADSHSWGAYLVVVCRAVAQREVTVGKNSVCGNTLLEMPFEFRQVSQS